MCWDADFNSSSAHLPSGLSKRSLKRDFLNVYVTTFSDTVDWETQKLWGPSFPSKCSKFNLIFINAAKKLEKVFCFWDNCIWIGIVRLSLLRTGYISSAANVLKSSPNIIHANKRDFFRLSWPGSDQWIW